MNDLTEIVTKLAQNAVGRIHVRSALNPILWLCGIASPICFTFACIMKSSSQFSTWLLIGGLFPIFVACLAFAGFAIFCPAKLQSEEYQLKHESLQILQQKNGRRSISPSVIEAIANPQSKQLEYREGNDA